MTNSNSIMNEYLVYKLQLTSKNT